MGDEAGALGLSKSECPGCMTSFAEQFDFLHKIGWYFSSNSLPPINYSSFFITLPATSQAHLSTVLYT